jgi:hypothetical protein
MQSIELTAIIGGGVLIWLFCALIARRVNPVSRRTANILTRALAIALICGMAVATIALVTSIFDPGLKVPLVMQVVISTLIVISLASMGAFCVELRIKLEEKAE